MNSQANISSSGLAAKRKHQAEIASQAGEIELYQFALNEQQQYEAVLLA